MKGTDIKDYLWESHLHPKFFQRVFRDIFASVDGLEIIMDNFLIAATSLEEHNRILRQTLQTGKENNVTFSPKKLQFCTDWVKYGHTVRPRQNSCHI